MAIRNCGNEAAEGMVLTCPEGLEVGRPDGAALPSCSGGVVLPRLAPGEILQLESNRPGNQAIHAGAPGIEPHERRRMEYLNYLGLLRGAARDRVHYARERRQALLAR